MIKKLFTRINKTKVKYSETIENLDLNTTQKQVLDTVWLEYLLILNSSAKKGWLSHNYSQVAVIVISLLIPVIEQITWINKIFDLELTLVSIFGLIVAALTSLNRQFGFEEKWRHYRLGAETMRNEGDDYFALSGKYEKFLSHKEAFKLFTGTITSYKRQEVNTYIEEKINRTKDEKKPV